MKGNDICDGFGNSWSRCKLGADCGLHVVRPGKARCWCQDQEASRDKVQSAREEIAKLESDNERLRKESKAAKIDRDAAGWDDYAVISELKRENAALRERISTIPDDVWSNADLVKQIHQALAERDDANQKVAALKIERNCYRVALQDIADASGEWAGDKAREVLRKEAQP